MLQEDKITNAVMALNRLFICARSRVSEGELKRAYRLLDEADYLSQLIVEENIDNTEKFNQALIELTELDTNFQLALDAYNATSFGNKSMHPLIRN